MFVKIVFAFMTIIFLMSEELKHQTSGLMVKEQTTLEKEKIQELENHFDNITSELQRASFEDTSPIVFIRQHTNESMEKIQLVKNGIVTKSAFIPVNADSSVVRIREIEETTKNESTPLIHFNDSSVRKDKKKFRLVKVKKNIRNMTKDPLSQDIQRRSFRLLPNFLSMLPVRWMTRGKKTDSTGLESSNSTSWSKLNNINKEEENSKELAPQTHGSEKIKKLLNLFTIVKFDNGDCYADGAKGVCLHQTECEEKGWKFAGTCANDLGVCCYNEKTCGQQSKDDCTYFVNEGYPEPEISAPKVCALTIDKSDANVKQLRLDFLIFQLRDPLNGTCLHDRLVVTGQNTNDIIPEICGVNTGQHIYVDVEESNGPYNLNVITVGEYFPRNFRIKVTQLKKSEELAPKNCLQYYTEPTGVVQTFNYQQFVEENIDGFVGYFNNLNYAICIKKVKDFCSVSYENEEADDAIHPTFQLVNVDADGEKLLPPKQAGAETFDCPDDYIIINGIRLCGEKLNDASVEIDFTKNYPVTDTSNGPFILSVRTDATISGRGFSLKYTQNPCFV